MLTNDIFNFEQLAPDGKNKALDLGFIFTSTAKYVYNNVIYFTLCFSFSQQASFLSLALAWQCVFPIYVPSSCPGLALSKSL